MNVMGWLFCLALWQQAPAVVQPVDPEVRARFSVTVTASDTVTARVYEYLGLVLLFESHPKMPWNRRDIGTVNLRLSPENDTALVEYCLRRCLEQNPELVTYRSTLDAFLKKLDAASAGLARRYR